MPTGVGLGIGVGLANLTRGAYDPIVELGSKLIEDWSAAHGVTVVSDRVSAWTGRKLGIVVGQSVAGSRPAYSPTAYDGKPGITPDSLDDYLDIIPAPAQLPDGVEPGEIWVFKKFIVDPSVTSAMTDVMYGNTVNDGRRVLRLVTAGNVQARSQVGNGAATVSRTSGTVALGKHVLRATISATATGLTVDTLTDATPSAVVPATVLTRLRFFATSVATPAGFAGDIYNRILMTEPLSNAEAAGLLAFGLTQ